MAQIKPLVESLGIGKFRKLLKSKPTKSWLITKVEIHALAKEIFKNTKVKVTNSGKRYQGLVISVTCTVTFKKMYTDEIVSQWTFEMKVLSQIVKIEPQAGLCCFTAGFKYKVTYHTCETPNKNEELRR